MNVARSGLRVDRTRLDAISDNIANLNTVRPTSGPAFQSRLVIAEAEAEGGVRVQDIALSSGEGRLVSEPGHPLADADGLVRYPDTDLSEQMVAMLVAQRGYQANLAVVERVRDAYLQAIRIGS